jgi:methylmalonyl-CoA mutase N-terminal domain/subunit
LSERRKLTEIQNKKRKWEKTAVLKWVRAVPERKRKFTTSSEFLVKRLYTPDDVRQIDYVEDLGFPGEYPFTRGVHATMHRGRLWTMRQFAGFGTAKETNARFKYLLKEGETGLSIAFDMPTIWGYDSDHSMAEGEVGRCGVAISSLKDMEILFNGIPLDRVSTSMTINGPANVLLSMYIAVGEKQNAPQSQLSGTTQNDILKEFFAQKLVIFPPKPSVKLVIDTIEYCSKFMPKWNPVSISGYHIREAGSNAVQELAFTLADGITYVQEALDRGLKVDEFAPRLSFFFACHNDLFEEVAKFRAGRKIWARIMKERFRARDSRSMWMRMHVQTSGCTLTAQQPMNNIVRVTLQALGAVLGGTQSLHSNSFDEALALPSEEAVRIALRTQQIIAHESGVANTIDPLGGSYYLEALTAEMEEEALEYIDRIERMGGVIPAIEKGYFQREIANSAYKYQREIDNKERMIVGVNQYASEEKQPIPLLRISPDVEETQVDRLKALKNSRDSRRVQQVLDRLRSSADSDKNLMPTILEAVKAYATLGEICGVLREVYGEYQELIVF